MKFNDQFTFVRNHMKKNRLRLFMTVLATTISCAFLIVLVSVGFGLQKYVKDEVVAETELLTVVKVHGKENGDEVTKQDIDKMKDIEGVKVVTEREELWGVTTHLDDRLTSNSAVELVNFEDEKKSNFSLSEGRLPENKNEVVVGPSFAQYLWTKDEQRIYEEEGEIPEGGYEGELLDKAITSIVEKEEEVESTKTKEFSYTIVGIAEEPSRDYLEDPNIYVSSEYKQDFVTFFGDESSLNPKEINVYTQDIEDVKFVTNELKDDGFYVYSISEEMERIDLYFSVFKAGLLFVGVIALIISAIGIFNTMTMAVTERTQEIGIMKAIGMSPQSIKRMFLLESAYIGVLGATIGVALSYGVSTLCNMVLPMVIQGVLESETPDDLMFSYIPIELVLGATIICITVAIVSGLRPATKATKVNVLSALRKEI
ncbi:FtsX-like permease family protein [Bacillus carboniphilus]|uniref:FtsX-like permease family protein n=1 Tax=Bacillus carboniphilus TaxID=86663 RepID=A0ABY9JP32_9BACI|nr:FtsX-like permease family protein [Bacillus carboniphilus]WLR41167.1 FtsX-like permease family protein [Bacillus carboniphilus]